MLTLLTTGCASKVAYEPADLVSTADQGIITITDNTEIKLDTLYSRKIQKDSVFQRVGSISQGEVYKPVDDIFTVEGANVHEAYLVISGVKLIGFYLPGKDSFSKLKNVVQLPISQE